MQGSTCIVNREMWVQPFGQEDPLEEGISMYTHSSILVWRIPRTERSLSGHTVHRVEKESDMTEVT